MQALVFEPSVPRLALTRVMGFASPRAFVSRVAPIALRERRRVRTPVYPDLPRMRRVLVELAHR